jgi:predicted Na+-dependent transporter
LILIPLLVSRYLRKFEVKYSKEVINIGFGIVIYTVIALNKNLFFQDLSLILLIALICLLRTFVSGTTVLLVAKPRMEIESTIVKMLFGSYKNLGLSATVALLLFGEKSSLPSAICIVFEILLFTYYSYVLKFLARS